MSGQTTEERREKVAGRAAARDVIEGTEGCSPFYQEGFYEELLDLMPIHLVLEKAAKEQLDEQG